MSQYVCTEVLRTHYVFAVPSRRPFPCVSQSTSDMALRHGNPRVFLLRYLSITYRVSSPLSPRVSDMQSH